MDPAAIVLGLTSALTWGTSDFAGGMASRTIGSLSTATVAQAVGLVAVGAVAVLAAESTPGQAEFLWSLAAGVGGAVAIATFYRALAVGEMGFVAPLTGAIGAGAPVIVSFALGETVAPPQAAGIAFALAAVVVASLGTRTGHRLAPRSVRSRGGPRLRLLLRGHGPGHGRERPRLVAAVHGPGERGRGAWDRSTTARNVSLRAAMPRLPLLVLVGLGDLGGSLFFMLANARGPLSVAVVLSSLYPVTTAVLARLVLRERLRPPQLVGAGLAIVGILLIAL